MFLNILTISTVCPRHCNIEFMKHVLPRLVNPTRPPDSGSEMSLLVTDRSLASGNTTVQDMHD